MCLELKFFFNVLTTVYIFTYVNLQNKAECNNKMGFNTGHDLQHLQMITKTHKNL